MFFIFPSQDIEIETALFQAAHDVLCWTRLLPALQVFLRGSSKRFSVKLIRSHRADLFDGNVSIEWVHSHPLAKGIDHFLCVRHVLLLLLQLRLQLLDRGAKFLAHKLTFNHNTRTLDVAQRVLEQSSNVSMAAAQVANSCPWCVITYNKQHASCFNTYT